MDNAEIIDDQIIAQLTDSITVKVHFSDVAITDFIALFEQDGGIYVQAPFCDAKRIPAAIFVELKSQFTDEQQFNTDPEVIRSSLSYDEFYDRYYNTLN